jgi:hypothetical protein
MGDTPHDDPLRCSAARLPVAHMKGYWHFC